ncbi:MAG: phosphate ABC transporter ATP-binding protein [Candidatus Lernaella stagnicola]|nr:phosphate ABC transporter ATP-binding protein [Candidatus Lernaella stagnicola]
MPHISVRHLNVFYGNEHALKDVSVDIPDGNITAIIGPSGCGKTTLLKSLNRLIDLYDGTRAEGQILIDGQNILASDADVLSLRKKIGYLAQRPYPLPMSITDNITFGPRIHGMKGDDLLARLAHHMRRHELPDFDPDAALKQAQSVKRGELTLLVEFYLRLAGLWEEVKDRLTSPASRLSIGQQQRLALARTLSVEPEVILADEPTSALDPISANAIEKRFQLLKSDYSIIVVTHILRQARRIADHVLFMYLGELIEHAPAEQFFTAPQDVRTQRYISGEVLLTANGTQTPAADGDAD